MAQEIELKLDLSEMAAEALAHWDALPPLDDVLHLQSVYFDTPQAQLAQRGMSLRIRKSGKRRIQTVKADGGQAAGLFDRREWEMPVRGGAPILDERTPVAAMLGDDAALLAPAFEVDVSRSRWIMQEGDAQVELVLDRGAVRADGREAALCEIELELLAGSPAALFAIARRIDGKVPVRLGVLAKAERGYRLRGAVVDGVKAEPIALDPGIMAGAAFLKIAAACLRHYRLNEAILLDHYEPKALHQARVSIRRLRTALTLFKPILLEGDVARFQQELRWLAATLGEARDVDVLAGRVEDDAARALLADAQVQAHARVDQWLHSARVRALFIDLSEWLALGAGCGGDAGRPMADFAAQRLQRFRKRVLKGGRHMRRLSDPDRHQVRKDAKKLRYGAEFFSDLFDRKKQRARQRDLLQALESVQDRLGELNDLATAPALLERHGLSADMLPDPGARRQMLDDAADARRALKDIRPFWA